MKNDAIEDIPDYTLLIDRSFREYIEERFYRRVAERARLEHLQSDTQFLQDPQSHLGLYSDHSHIHVRDVARQTLEVLAIAHGKLIPVYEAAEWEFMQSLSVHLAYLHDIGMAEFSKEGRFMHPEYAAQFVFQPDFQPLLDQLWKGNSGGLPSFLQEYLKPLGMQPKAKDILREMLALAQAHSKSKAPAHWFDNIGEFRTKLQHIISTPLTLLYEQQKHKKPAPKAWAHGFPLVERPPTYTEIWPRDAFTWLQEESLPLRRLSVMVIDVIRCLRAADALRQRGSTLRTSAGYEILINRKNGHAVYALRSRQQERLFLVEIKKPINAGEANIRQSKIARDGHLHISISQAEFDNAPARRRAAQNAAVAIMDIQKDVLGSFLLSSRIYKPLFKRVPRLGSRMKTVIHSPHLPFLVDIYKAILKADFELGLRIEMESDLPIESSLRVVSEEPKMQSAATYFSLQQAQSTLQAILDTGLHLPEGAAEAEVLLAEAAVLELPAYEVLMRPMDNSLAVFFALEYPLLIKPLGGYEPKEAPPFVALGTTGVVRGLKRNALVRNGPHNQAILRVPAHWFLKHWFHPIPARQLKNIFKHHAGNNL